MAMSGISKVKCEGCRLEITNKIFLTCVLCCQKYDLLCANVPEKHFHHLMTPERKKNWKCPQCITKIPKTGNTNTPIRPQQSAEQKQQTAHQSMLNLSERENVTLRTKSQHNFNDDSSCPEYSAILGDTMCSEASFDKAQTQLTMENLSEMISEKLEKNNKSLLCQFQNLIQIEVEKAIGELKGKIKDELKFEIDELLKFNECRQKEIDQINNEFEKLKTETKNLKCELQEIENKFKTKDNNSLISTPESNRKKIVLYGFPEYYRESDFELQNRLCDTFHEHLQINLVGYIEETRRIGKFNNSKTRPLVVELISKRMTNYLLENKRYLYGSKLAISGFLDETARTERQTMREKMLNARKQGFYAVIRDNKLIIKDKINEAGGEVNSLKRSFAYQEKNRPFRV